MILSHKEKVREKKTKWKTETCKRKDEKVGREEQVTKTHEKKQAKNREEKGGERKNK